MASSGDGDRAPTSGDAPTSSAAVRPKLPPPPEVGPSEPPRERTVVTRAPARASGPADPKELLPTLRMPPVEARAVRREADDLAARLGIGGGAKRAAKPDATDESATTSTASSEPVVSTEVVRQSDEVTKRSAPPIDPRELVPTMQLPAVAPLPEHRERSAHPQARRPPLPLPSVLRSGPRTLAGPRMPPPAETTATSSERSGPRPGMPEPMPVIDTATLVADVAEQLYEAEAAEEAARVAAAAAARAAEAATSDPADRDAPAILEPVHVAPTPAIPRIPTMVAEPIEDEIANDEPPRKLGWIAAIAAVVVATIGLASYRWSSDAQEVEPAARTEAALSSPAADEQTHATAMPTKPPAPALALAPTPPPVPAVDPPPIDPIDPIVPPPVEPAPIAPVATPLSEAVPPPPALAVEDDEAPPEPVAAAPAPAVKKATAPPKHAKSSKHASKSAKKDPTPAPPPAPAKQASSAPAASTAGKQDAAALLKEAEAAYGKGSWGTALRNAQKSNGMRSDARALKIIALSACRLGKESTAQNAFDRLPLGMRKSVRTTCRDVGIRLRI